LNRAAATMDTSRPDLDCPLCPRLRVFRETNRGLFPTWHNGPVPSFGSEDPHLLIVGLAPGLRGANRTGRPFTGDYAGELLYQTLVRFGLAEGQFRGEADDGMRLIGCRITNAVRCVPPKNRPTPAEIANCGRFLTTEIANLKSLRSILALGTVAHYAVLAAFGLRKKEAPFGHGALHSIPHNLVLADSYHCSRYNTNTGRLTRAMFESVFENLVQPRPA